MVNSIAWYIGHVVRTVAVITSLYISFCSAACSVLAHTQSISCKHAAYLHQHVVSSSVAVISLYSCSVHTSFRLLHANMFVNALTQCFGVR
jgi:hypothetical protein